MLRLRKGSKVPFPEKLSEGYEYSAPCFAANVSADKLEALMKHFITLHNEPLFFILELPTRQEDETEVRPGAVKTLHKDVYYIDGCTQDDALAILAETVGLIVNDGMCAFGFGCHQSHDEIMVGKYNVVTVHTRDKAAYDGYFEEHGIPLTENLITAWDTFSKDHPGESSIVDTDGKSVYDIPEILKDRGIYFADRRED